jgi:hypothetical protein
MGKLTAVIAGYISITFAAYVVLSIAYNPLINWLGPYFGYRFPLVLGIIYLEAGSPFKNLEILESWVIIGVIVGIAARKGFRAWGSASLVWTLTTITLMLSTIAILGISIFSLPDISSMVSTLSSSLSIVIAATAFVPYSTNIATIATEPVLRILIPYLSSSITSGSTGGISGGLMAIGIHAFENYIIFVVTAIISGSAMHRILYDKRKVSKKAVAAAISIFIVFIFVAMAASSGIAAPANDLQSIQASHGTADIASNAIFPFSVSDGKVHLNTCDVTGAYGIDGPMQAGLSIITPHGNLYNLFTMSSENTSIWQGNGLMFGAFAVTSNMTSLLEKEYGISYGKFGNLMPQNVLLLGYNGSGHSNQAASTANSIGNYMGTTFNSVLTLKNISNGNHDIIIYLYSSPESVAKLKSDFISVFNGNGDISKIFSKDENLNNYNSFAMASGYINSSITKSLNTGLNLSNIDFTAGVFEYPQYFHSSGDYHTYNLSGLMDYRNNISFNTSSGFSLLGIGYNNGTGSITSISKYNFIIYTNNASLADRTPLKTANSKFIHENSQSFSLSSVSASFNEVFPADLLYGTSVKKLGTNTVSITVHIKNNDTSNITDFNASQSAFVNNYVKYGAAHLISGNYSESNMTLYPGQYANFTYSMSLSGVGSYVIPYTNISYNFQGKSFSYETVAVNIVQNKPGYLHAMNSMVNGEASQYAVLGNAIATIDGFGISLIDLILGLIVIIDIVIEILGLKRFIEYRSG